MATGRVLVVHESGGTRALLAELLSAEGLSVEAVPSTIQCISRFVDEPAGMVVLGLSGLEQTELDLIKTLKAEAQPPRIVVCFPSPKRDIAVRALQAGADGYVLEPFYPSELVALVKAHLRPVAPEAPADLLAHFAGEVAHAINNPLQVILLLLAKDRVTKKELMDHIPENVERIHRAVTLLKEYGALPTPVPVPGDCVAVVEAAAAAAGVELEVARAVLAVLAVFDERALSSALASLFDAVQPELVRLSVEPDTVTLHVDGEGEGLLEHVLVVTPEREIRPGLLLAATLLERQGGSLAAERGSIVARLPRA